MTKKNNTSASIVLLMFSVVIGSADVSAESGVKDIDGEIRAYFPAQPRLNGEAGSGDFQLRSYEHTDEDNLIVYTASYQIAPNDFDGQAAEDVIRDYVKGQALSVSGEVVEFEKTAIGDASAEFSIHFRYGDATMRKFAIVALEDGRLKQWAVQDIVGYSIQDAEEIFENHADDTRF